MNDIPIFDVILARRNFDSLGHAIDQIIVFRDWPIETLDHFVNTLDLIPDDSVMLTIYTSNSNQLMFLGRLEDYLSQGQRKLAEA